MMQNKQVTQNFENAKTSILNLTYEEKIMLREWLETKIQSEMADHTKKRAEEVSNQFGSFLNKASSVVGKAGNSLKDSFNSAFNKDNKAQ